MASIESVLNQSENCPGEFARIIGCTFCSKNLFPVLLRDEAENVPQPGYIGHGYWRTRVLLVGQNPGVPTSALAHADRPYTSALRSLRDDPTPKKLDALNAVLSDFIPRWPIHGSYFPLEECGLSLNDIACCNLVRCRTVKNKNPGRRVAMRCVEQHFVRWLDMLEPRVVIFLGKWAHDNGVEFIQERNILSHYMNRQRSLSTGQRRTNREEVIALVTKVIGDTLPKGMA